MNLKNKSILITGATGSFGKEFIKYLIANHQNLKKLVLFSRDELKQLEIRKNYAKNKFFKKMRFFLGDIRDKDRLITAFRNIDIIIHAAALKQVDTAEYNPNEFIKTNIYGAQNIIDAAVYNNVSKVIALSTDKASSPVNLYGATKLCSDKLFISANFFYGQRKFSVVRYGNVEGSRGSVIPSFLSLKKNDELNITHKEMTRFSISLKKSVELVIWSIKNAFGGEIIIPKIPSYRLTDLAKAINPRAKIKFIGIRPGEKIHEEMISFSESINSLELKDKFVILPSFTNPPHFYKVNNIINYYKKKFNSKKKNKMFNYNSGSNKYFLTTKELRKIIINIKNNYQ
jgi:UDP-N-acetylglucosamine 4,6-dehydratase (inverting)